MQLTTILNRHNKYKSFVYQRVSWTDDHDGLEIHIVPRKNSKPVCSGCGQPGPIYDHPRTVRRFDFIPMWGLTVCFLYRMRRVNCRTCGVKTEAVPWSNGKHRTTTMYRWFLAHWAKRLSWTETAQAFGTSWGTVFRSVKYAVEWGIAHDSWQGITAIGIDEIAWRKGHRYMTLVYQIDSSGKRLLHIAQGRSKEALESFFKLFPAKYCAQLKFIVSDMWKPYLEVIKERAPQAVHVLDKFHIMMNMNKAIDEIRRDEARRLCEDGYEPVLKHSRWCLLKRPENLTDKQTVTINEILQYNLKSVRAYMHREEFQRFWDYNSPCWAGKFLDEWTARVMRSRLEPLKKVARSLRRHRELLLNFFRAQKEYTSGIVEGFNNKAKLNMKKAYGFRTQTALETALYHTLGKLPEPNFTHTFW